MSRHIIIKDMDDDFDVNDDDDETKNRIIKNEEDEEKEKEGGHVLFCGEEFPAGFESCARHAMPLGIAIHNCPRGEVKRRIQRYDVAVPLMTRVDEDVLEGRGGTEEEEDKKGRGGGKLKLVLQFGVGLEGVSIDAATKRDIKVGRIRSDKTPNAQSTAEMGVFLTLAALKRANECRTSVLRRTLGAPMGHSLFGAHVLFIGFGRVAKAQARMMKHGFGCKIFALVRRKRGEGKREDNEEEEEEDKALLEDTFEGDISNVDFVGRFPSEGNNVVVVACTCTRENRKMVNDHFIEQLKFGEKRVPGIVVNVARGALVDERAMRMACDSGKVLYYATDVCFEEPVDVDGDLLGPDENGKRASNIFVTPHVGGVTVNSYEKMGKIIAEYAAKIVNEKKEIESDECVSIVN